MIISRKQKVLHELEILNQLAKNADSIKTFTHAATSSFDSSSCHTVTKANSFSIDSLPHPLRGYANKALTVSSGAAVAAAAVVASVTPTEKLSKTRVSSSLVADTSSIRMDELEISVRGHLLSLTLAFVEAVEASAASPSTHSENEGSSLTTSFSLDECIDAVEELLLFVRSVADLCLYIITMSATQQHGKEGMVTGNSKNYSFQGMDTHILRKLPFVLLDDAVDSLPITHLRLFWTFGPSQWLYQWCNSSSNVRSKESDSSGLLFTPQTSRFLLIRSCNKVLKKLCVDIRQDDFTTSITSSVPWHQHDRTSNTSTQLSPECVSSAAGFAGQISLILASVFPLSERSAINVLGFFHSENAVRYESIDEFISQQQNQKQHDQDSGPNDPDPVSLDKLQDTSQVNYDFYAAFWGVQQCFADPIAFLPSAKDATASSTHTSPHNNVQREWIHKLNKILVHVQLILGTFEEKTFSKEDIRHATDRWLAAKKIPIATSSTADMNHTPDQTYTQTWNTSPSSLLGRSYKYLTNSQLLHLQLQDPEIRVHFLTQLLIISSFLSHSIHEYLASNGSLLPVSIKTTCLNVLTTIAQASKRTEHILSQTPPNGAEHFATFSWILKDRETIWKAWKKNKCNPPIEKFFNRTNESNTAQSEDVYSVSKNHEETFNSDATVKKSAVAVSTPSETISSGSDRTKNLYSFRIDLRLDLPSLSRDLRYSSVPNLYDHLGAYVDSLDPDAGIEDEYNPKSDKLWAWRTTRLLCENYMGYWDGCILRKKDGDFEKIVRKIWKEERGIEIPGEDAFQQVAEDDTNDDDEIVADVGTGPCTGEKGLNVSDGTAQGDSYIHSVIDDQAVTEMNQNESLSDEIRLEQASMKSSVLLVDEIEADTKHFDTSDKSPPKALCTTDMDDEVMVVPSLETGTKSEVEKDIPEGGDSKAVPSDDVKERQCEVIELNANGEDYEAGEVITSVDQNKRLTKQDMEVSNEAGISVDDSRKRKNPDETAMKDQKPPNTVYPAQRSINHQEFRRDDAASSQGRMNNPETTRRRIIHDDRRGSLNTQLYTAMYRDDRRRPNVASSSQTIGWHDPRNAPPPQHGNDVMTTGGKRQYDSYSQHTSPPQQPSHQSLPSSSDIQGTENRGTGRGARHAERPQGRSWRRS